MTKLTEDLLPKLRNQIQVGARHPPRSVCQSSQGRREAHLQHDGSSFQRAYPRQLCPPGVEELPDTATSGARWDHRCQPANGVEYTVDGVVVPVDLNLLPDDIIAEDIQDGLEEEFTTVGQLSLIFQGVYAPDARFNAFADDMLQLVLDVTVDEMNLQQLLLTLGTLVLGEEGNAIGGGVVRGLTNVKRFGNAEVQIAGNLTLVRSHYVYGPLNVELVFHTDKGVKTINSTLTALAAHAVAEVNDNSSKLIDFIIDRYIKEQNGLFLETGFADDYGNFSEPIIRAHWLTGPLDLIIDYRASPGITRVRTGLQAVQLDTLTVIDRFGAEMSDFHIVSPLFDYMPYFGNRTLAQQQMTELVVRHLFSNTSFMSLLLRDSFEIASYDKIIPQFGTESNYYSVLKYLFNRVPVASGRSQSVPQGVSIPGIPSAVAAYLANAAHTARAALENLG
ncbi:hypothetical protein Hamer_G005061 [Homarus americanus]|uniref:Uncharacterized protein n=1 Tax=Homarus americanus TaxID=6706 RepID=A0A8J5JUX5_HOMAM|nr:hypothetical protein Hamer_G005061 [Homarus americanus]